ncbi:MAG: YeeE/YedE thiosulfate transporter family protein [Pseudomonadota bacterium]|nr:YeeE/YedE thiosulfate transporter family protein [Pseudomonadota bacterium]
MSIDFQNFTPYASLIGGVMIGLAALLLMLAHGRVMGVSGILGGIVMPSGKSDIGWRILFVIGMLAGPFAVIHLLDRPVDIMPAASGMILPVAGFIVGLGTAIGSGCTSGHGICGLARLSPRSFVAVGAFMATGIATVFLVRHVM